MIRPVVTTIFLVLTLTISVTAYAGILTIFVIPSAHGWDLSTPRTLIWSSFKNQNSRQLRPYGHGMYHLRCQIGDGDAVNFDELSGVMVNLDYASSLPLKYGYGLGTLFATMPGYLEGPDEARYVLSTYMRAGLVAFLQFKISSQTCSRLTEFLTEYRNLGLDQKYGLTLDPRRMEGADCTSFLAALMEIAGLSNLGLKHIWQNILLVPYQMVGGPLTGRFIPPRRFFFRPFSGRRWAAANEPHFAAQVYHPDFLYNHIIERWEQNLSPFIDSNPPVGISTMNEARGFIVDARHMATPNEPLWK